MKLGGGAASQWVPRCAAQIEGVGRAGAGGGGLFLAGVDRVWACDGALIGIIGQHPRIPRGC